MGLRFDSEDRPILPQLAQLKFTDWGKALFNIVRKNHDREDRAFKEAPQENNEDVRRDWRYRLGRIEALHDVLQLPDDANVNS